MQELWVQSLGQEDSLEEGMENHCSILAQRIPQTEEPGGLQSTGLHRLRHDWSDLARMHHNDGFGQVEESVLVSCNPPYTSFSQPPLGLKNPRALVESTLLQILSWRTSLLQAPLGNHNTITKPGTASQTLRCRGFAKGGDKLERGERVSDPPPQSWRGLG